MLNFNTREFPNLARALGGWGKSENPVAANFRFSCEGVVEGEGWGEEFRHGGGAASLGVLLKVGSSKVQNFPPVSPF